MERSVAIVGSRAATAHRSGIAADLAADLVEQGVTVVSGGAFGIDVAAHRGGPAAGGSTETLAKDQLIVSELPPAAHRPRVRFPDPKSADRWSVSRHFGLEPALRSCARNNAGWALACGRPHGGAGSGVLHDHSLLTGEDQQL